jgi:hypothetical protein
MDNLCSNFARICPCFVSNAWCQETCIWMSNGFMNATISLEKANDWSGTKIVFLCNEATHSCYQSIDNKHIQICVKFENRLSIPYRRKMRSKREGVFPRGCLSFFQKAGSEMILKFELFENYSVLNPKCFVKSCLFLRNEIYNPSSNFTGNTIQCISNNWY